MGPVVLSNDEQNVFRRQLIYAPFNRLLDAGIATHGLLETMRATARLNDLVNALFYDNKLRYGPGTALAEREMSRNIIEYLNPIYPNAKNATDLLHPLLLNVQSSTSGDAAALDSPLNVQKGDVEGKDTQGDQGNTSGNVGRQLSGQTTQRFKHFPFSPLVMTSSIRHGGAAFSSMGGTIGGGGQDPHKPNQGRPGRAHEKERTDPPLTKSQKKNRARKLHKQQVATEAHRSLSPLEVDEYAVRRRRLGKFSLHFSVHFQFVAELGLQNFSWAVHQERAGHDQRSESKKIERISVSLSNFDMFKSLMFS